MNKSIWLDNMSFKNTVSLKKDLDVDVLIVGGGITGLSVAYHLIDSNLKVCVVEKNKVGCAATARSTAKLTFMQEDIYNKLDINKSRLYLESQIDAINIVKNIISKNNIDCDLNTSDSYIFSNKMDNINYLKKEATILEKLGIDIKKTKRIPFNIKSVYAIKSENTYVFHPVKYVLKLKDIIVKKGIDIYEDSTLTNIAREKEHYVCTINGSKITTKNIVMATHYPYFLLPYMLPLKTSIEKTYISASIYKNDNFSAITINKPVESIRFYKDYLIYANGSHNLCTKYNYKENFDNLTKRLKKLKLKPDYLWSNHDIMTFDSLPLIGLIDKNFFVATGYNTWGMTNGSIAGLIISDLILKKDNKYKELFNPKRNGLLKGIKYPLDTVYNIKSFFQTKLFKNKNWYNNISFKMIDGKSVGTYIDESNKEHTVYNKCPHLGCSLIFNEVEKTWDCPCHGSRFDLDGKSICGPSNYNITYKKYE